jgi:hypothetical protein
MTKFVMYLTRHPKKRGERAHILILETIAL